MMQEVKLLAFMKESGLVLEREGESLVATPSQALTPEIRMLIKAYKADLLANLSTPSARVLSVQKPNDPARVYFMRIMVEWNERAALMTCRDCPAENAELAAWHDLGLDEVFFDLRTLN